MSPSNISDIAGGIVGGVATLGVLLFYIRRRRRQGLALPIRSGSRTLPHDSPSVEYNITPFPHPEQTMHQYRNSPGFSADAVVTGVGCAKPPLIIPSQPSDSPTPGYPQNLGPLSGEVYQPLVLPGQGQHLQGPDIDSMHQHHSHNPHAFSLSGCTMKERNVASHQQLEQVNGESGESSGVIQHQDAGRVPSEEALLRDIPPAYDSIMQ